VSKPGVKAGQKETLAVFAVSAFWHGFYPFYYFLFAHAALFAELTKEIYRARALFKSIPGPVSSVLCNVLSMLVMNYMGTSFCNLTFERGNNVAKGNYYIVSIAMLTLPFIVKGMGLAKMAQKLEKKKT
jgi:lysophospholipid acyltransferase